MRLFEAVITAISPETLTIILAALIPVFTTVGSIVTAIVTTSHSASKDQVKELKEWIETLDKRLNDEIEQNELMKAKLEEYQTERDQYREESRKLSRDVEKLSVQLEEKTSKVTEQDKKIKDQDIKIREQDKKIKEQDKRIMDQDQQMAMMAQEIEGLRLEVKRLIGGECGD